MVFCFIPEKEKKHIVIKSKIFAQVFFIDKIVSTRKCLRKESGKKQFSYSAYLKYEREID